METVERCLTCKCYLPVPYQGGRCPVCAKVVLDARDARIAALEAQLATQVTWLGDCEEDMSAAYARISELEAQLERYAPTDGDERSTEELLALYFRMDDEGGTYCTNEGEAPTARAALLAALKERGQ